MDHRSGRAASVYAYVRVDLNVPENVNAKRTTYGNGSRTRDARRASEHPLISTQSKPSCGKSSCKRVQANTLCFTSSILTVLMQVPHGTPALHREFPGTALALIPVDDLTQAVSLANSALRRNLREAWTAVVFFGAEHELASLPARMPSFRYLRGGVVARVKLQLTHQGAYFALDLMRRVTVE